MQTNVALPLSSLSPEMSQRSPLQGGGSLSGKRLPDAASVAREFESVFVSMMLKTMRQSMSKDMFAGDDSDTFGGMFDAFMGQHIAENGGIGMAKLFAEAGVSGNAGSVLNGTRATDAVSSQVKPLQEEKLKAYKDAAALAE